jgi:small ligand-binding sensory domain FIST
MPFAAALSTVEPTLQAVEEVCELVRARLSGDADLAVLFFSTHHVRAATVLARTVQERLSPRCLLGSVAEAVIGGNQEIEQSPAVSLWASRWDKPLTLTPFHLVLERTADGPSLFGWPDELTGSDPAQTAVLLFGDPFTFPIDLFLRRINEDSPGVRVLGGMASGIRSAGQCRLLFQDTVQDQGAIGVLLQGSLGLRSIVSQGCRPIGRPLVITRAKDNLILELGGKSPLMQLQQLWATLTPQEQGLFQQGLHIGRVLNEYQGDFQRGDFLVRNVLALERETGALAITDRVRVGQTVQFHVRDAATADEDLHALLRLDREAHEHKPKAALLFSCNGRGSRLFPEPHHDARALCAEVGEIPLAGFFAQGELGPVGGQNFVHGFTASIALFEE